MTAKWMMELRDTKKNKHDKTIFKESKIGENG